MEYKNPDAGHCDVGFHERSNLARVTAHEAGLLSGVLLSLRAPPVALPKGSKGTEDGSPGSKDGSSTPASLSGGASDKGSGSFGGGNGPATGIRGGASSDPAPAAGVQAGSTSSIKAANFENQVSEDLRIAGEGVQKALSDALVQKKLDVDKGDILAKGYLREDTTEGRAPLAPPK